MRYLHIKMAEFLTIALVVVLFGSSTFLRKMAIDGMNPLHLQAAASVIYACLLPLWLSLGPKWSNPTPIVGAYAVCAILTNVIGAVVFGFLLKSTSSASVLAAAVSTSPIVTALLSYFFLGEDFTLKKLLAVAFVLTGMALFHM